MINQEAVYKVATIDGDMLEIDGWELQQLLGMGKVKSYIEA